MSILCNSHSETLLFFLAAVILFFKCLANWDWFALFINQHPGLCDSSVAQISFTLVSSPHALSNRRRVSPHFVLSASNLPHCILCIGKFSYWHATPSYIYLLHNTYPSTIKHFVVIINHSSHLLINRKCPSNHKPRLTTLITTIPLSLKLFMPGDPT